MNTTAPKTFFVDVYFPSVPTPMRELVRFDPALGLSFNASFARRYAVFAPRLFVDRSSNPWLRHFAIVHLDGFPVPVRTLSA